jgi:hypothetical protein
MSNIVSFRMDGWALRIEAGQRPADYCATLIESCLFARRQSFPDTTQALVYGAFPIA